MGRVLLYGHLDDDLGQEGEGTLVPLHVGVSWDLFNLLHGYVL
jgi:hypothetical protein